MVTHYKESSCKHSPKAPSEKSDRDRIKRALRERGTSLSAWATDHGYPIPTAHAVVDRWAGRTDRAPHGGFARQIMSKLRDELGAEIIPFPNPDRPGDPSPPTTEHSHD